MQELFHVLLLQAFNNILTKSKINLKGYVCEKCGNGFNSIAWIIHNSIVLSLLQTSWIAPWTFSWQFEHKSIHLNDGYSKKRFKAEIIKVYKKIHQGTLQKHYNRKIYKCPTCKVIFWISNNWNAHIRLKLSDFCN